MAVLVTAYLVGGFRDFQTFFIFHFIYGLILPIDYCNISSRWLNHQPGIDDMYIYIYNYIYIYTYSNCIMHALRKNGLGQISQRFLSFFETQFSIAFAFPFGLRSIRVLFLNVLVIQKTYVGTVNYNDLTTTLLE